MAEACVAIREKLGRKIVVVGACTGFDAHTVGIDAIMNMKGYNHHFGLERYPGGGGPQPRRPGAEREAHRLRRQGERRRDPGEPDRHPEGRPHPQPDRARSSSSRRRGCASASSSAPAAPASATSSPSSSATTPASAREPTPSTSPPSSLRRLGSGLDFLFYGAAQRIELRRIPGSRRAEGDGRDGRDGRDQGSFRPPHRAARVADGKGAPRRLLRSRDPHRSRCAGRRGDRKLLASLVRHVRSPDPAACSRNRAGPRGCSDARSRDTPPARSATR